MTLPSIEECIDYGQSIGLSPDDSEHFYDHFESNGWKVGRNKMVSWKAAMRNWLRNKRKWNGDQDFNPSTIRDRESEARRAMGLERVDGKTQIEGGSSAWDAIGFESVDRDGGIVKRKGIQH